MCAYVLFAPRQIGIGTQIEIGIEMFIAFHNIHIRIRLIL